MMYADDTVIYLSSTSTSDIELKLNLDLANLSQWLHYNKLVQSGPQPELDTWWRYLTFQHGAQTKGHYQGGWQRGLEPSLHDRPT